ncbi:hypothetical protein GJV44_00884 [Candidatus Vallotia cooleyia]|nr:hypothetical protein GJV44_00884 [Candidatus Vallotia cooleyia]
MTKKLAHYSKKCVFAKANTKISYRPASQCCNIGTITCHMASVSVLFIYNTSKRSAYRKSPDADIVSIL